MNVKPRKLRVRIKDLQPAEQLVGFGFRCWLAGYQNGDITCWGAGWNRFAKQLGNAKAKPVVDDLAYWVQTICKCANRKMDCAPLDCVGFYQDECTAISLIAASQHNTCPALQACASTLLGADDIDEVLESSESFAYTLEQADVRLAGVLETN